MWKVARRPRWIAALVLALAVAAGFAALSQWQLARSVESATVVSRQTESVVPLESVAKPDGPVTTDAGGQLVTTRGELVAGDTIVLSGRINGGQTGYWVVAHVVTEGGAGLAVALGWAGEEAAAASVADALVDGPVEVSGRYLPSEGPQESDFEHGETRTLSTAALVNLWADASPSVYSGYVVSAAAPAGLEPIDSPRPADDVTLNWLNVFYAIEWVVFAGFAVFLWFRLVRDAWEREEEEAGRIN
jgi:cytochrome oxidase assembly protein ShyY1